MSVLSTTVRTLAATPAHPPTASPDDEPPATAVLDPKRPFIVTIDGPAKTGKSTVSHLLAFMLTRRLGVRFEFLNTGAMYRAAAVIARGAGLTPADEPAVVDAVAHADLSFDWHSSPPRIRTAAEARGQSAVRPLADQIAAEEIGQAASDFARLARLREHMVAKQRAFAREHHTLITEGRDQGSVVFPDAQMKFFLDASEDARVQRSLDTLRREGRTADPAELAARLRRRDLEDCLRKDGPLVCPIDAHHLDTTPLLEQQVAQRLADTVVTLVARTG